MAATDKAQSDLWASAPDVPVFSWLKEPQRSQLIREGATLHLLSMEWDGKHVIDGENTPRFVATFEAPDGNTLLYGFGAAGGKSRRDQINNWLRQQLKNGESRIPVQLVKRGS